MDAPDLTQPHAAISLHFKCFPATPDHAWHAESGRWFPMSATETKVAIYEDRVRGWFLRWAHELDRHHDAGFVVLMVVVGYLEGNQQYREGMTSEGKSGKFVIRAIRRVCPTLTKKQAKRFYTGVRCGLFHDGMTKAGVGIENRSPDPITVTASGILLVSPRALLSAIEDDFDRYLAVLRAPAGDDARAKFESRWADTPAPPTPWSRVQNAARALVMRIAGRFR